MIKKGGKLSNYPFYFLFLLPLFFSLHGYFENYPVVPLWACTKLFLKYTAISLLLTLFFFWIIRSWSAAAMMTFSIMALQIFFGPVHDFMKSLIPGSFLVKYVFLLPAIFIVFTALLFYLRKKKPAFVQLTKYLNILLLLFILIDAVQLGRKFSAPAKQNMLGSMRSCDTCSKPDIYLIITDNYAGNIALKETMDFDNSVFENALKQRGFHITDSSVSNYNYTLFSMASILSMDYVQGIMGSNSNLGDRKICFPKIDDNLLVDFLDHQGYKFRNNGIFKFASSLPKRSTIFYKVGVDLITAQTFLSRLDWDIRFHTVTKLKIRSEIKRVSYYHLRLNEALYKETWEEAETRSASPRFVYTHLEMPHYPFYFDSTGTPAKMEDLELFPDKVTIPRYVSYLKYCNRRFLELIDHILAKSSKPPIIVLMSDHGFREYPGDRADHKYHFMNLNAVLFPDRNYRGFYKGISAVNQFRVILNSQFGQQLPLLKDSTSFLIH